MFSAQQQLSLGIAFAKADSDGLERNVRDSAIEPGFVDLCSRSLGCTTSDGKYRLYFSGQDVDAHCFTAVKNNILLLLNGKNNRN